MTTTDQPTPTPRTDAQGYGDGRHPYVPTDFARQLERELAAEREIRLTAERSAVLANEHLDRERALADRLALILDDIGYYDGLPSGAKQPVTEALAAWKGARNDA